MERAKIYSNNKGWSLTDWLSSGEVKKLTKVFKKSKGWAQLVIAKNTDLKLDFYYINGDLIFKREIK